MTRTALQLEERWVGRVERRITLVRYKQLSDARLLLIVPLPSEDLYFTYLRYN